VVFLEILQADFQMQLSGTSDDVITGLVDEGQHTRIGFRETLKPFDKLGEILCVLDLNGALDDRGDRESHDLQVVGSVTGGQSTRLQQELINTDQTKNVTSRDIIDGIDLASHHKNGTLDSLDEEIVLLAGSIVGALDADLEARSNGTSEDTTESIKSALVGGWHHLRDIEHEGCLGIAVTNTNASLIIRGPFVKSLGTVLLGGDWGWQVEDHHLHERISSGKESSHDNLEELLALFLPILGADLDVELVNQSCDFVLLKVHDGGENSENRVKNELVESTL
jgi:hypothetical protein